MVRRALTDTVFLAAALGLALFIAAAGGIGIAVGRAGGLPMPWAALWLPALYLLALMSFAMLRLKIAGAQEKARFAVEEALAETQALYRLLAENATEVVLRTDTSGMIAYASPAMARQGGTVPESLIGRHLTDIVHPTHAGQVMGLHEDAIVGGETQERWAEFVAGGALKPVDPEGRDHWFEIQIHPLLQEDGRITGAVALIRNIDERKAFEEQLFEAGLTDPLTGLSNRRAFVAMLQHHLDQGAQGCLALFDLDHFKAINDQYGHEVGDKVLTIFAQLARSQVRQEDMVARIGGEKFAVILPRSTPEQAEQVCGRILTTFSGTTRVVGEAIVRTTASAGVAHIAGSADETMKVADLALYTAKAKGRDRLEVASRTRSGGRRW
ncbi:sensor domain-containing diguanylate cyclase [Novosphingobium cyanobacteriorum]|uniref:Sensor domain-containing diguanylate cyclase n=1 Tax=Novosphingobium cyanobacteriorum TaxID=3024215 RepID=A0ABT6CJN9_9SPHN|nr:sensor domain-containing diguanylate cyclase [Novosphingobium cyanobacteriorum]MDF8334106.1 sensor domain-containing diguanylate cyclase [Novosphingobium cyanobacteriorum]